jgi:peptidoglycan-associated lipoprotein
MHTGRVVAPVVLLTAALTIGACAKKTPPVARPMPSSSGSAAGASPTGSSVPRPPEPVAEPIAVPPEPSGVDPLKVSDIDKINQNSPFQPVFFAYDSSEIEPEYQLVLQANAGILKKYAEWVITIEGHSDERGTAEYNLALGNRRAAAAKAYLISLGIPADRLRTVSYGKEFPFEPAHNEAAWSKNRRAHFVLTSK